MTSTDPNAGTSDQPTGSDQARRTGAAGPQAQMYQDLIGLIAATARDGGNPSPVVDAITQTLVTVLGSGPAFATLDSLIAANQASGQMYHNAVANQQKTTIFGMMAAMKCVSALLDKPAADMSMSDMMRDLEDTGG